MRFFDWRGSSCPEDGADEVLMRLAAKLEEGVAVVDVAAFAHGIARIVLLEQTREASRLTGLGDAEPRAPRSADVAAAEDLAAALDECLDRLPADERRLVLAYYAGGEGLAKIQHRRRLAREVGLSPNALRIRLRRSRERLEACLGSRVERKAATRIAGSTHPRMET